MMTLLKEGKMLNHSNYGEVLILAISDVPGDDISVIGSNPFYPGKTFDPDKELMAKLGIKCVILWKRMISLKHHESVNIFWTWRQAYA